MKINIAITIDTECDKGARWKVKQPLSFDNTRKGIIENLQPIFDKYQVKATYLLSPEVMLDSPSVEVFKGLGSKVELGTHLHAEFIEPYSNVNTDNTNHFQSDFSRQIEKEKLTNLTKLFKNTFGYQPTSFRAGRFGISHDTLYLLQKLGYEVDSSVTPDMFWRNANGNYANFLGTPYQPYFPSIKDFRKEGELNILEVPVSTINPFLRNVPQGIKRQIKLKSRLQNIGFNIVAGKNKPLWIRPTFSDEQQMKYVTQLFTSKFKNRSVFLCMMFHSNEYCLGTSPYSMDNDALNMLQQRLDRYLKWLTSEHVCTFVTLSEIATNYKQ